MRQTLAAVVLALGVVYGCSDSGTDPAPPPVPGAVAALSGTVSGTVGATVAEPIRVRVTDTKGRNMQGATVSWSASADGTVSSATTTTGADGVAQVQWTLGGTAGAQTLTAAVAGVTPAMVTATAAAGAAASVAAQAGATQQATVGTAVATAPAVGVKDSFGNPVAGVAVTFAVAAGGGSVSGGSITTDAQGVATVGAWTLGGVAGTQALTATVAGLTPVTFTATAVAGSAASMAARAGVGQSATVGTAVATAPAVAVRDAHGNAVAGVAVTFAVTSGGGTITGASTTTNAQGAATLGSWTLGTTAGSNVLTASASGLLSATFTATGTAGAPASMTVRAGADQSATVATVVAVAPSVTVRDQHGNPVAGAAVDFTPGTNSGTVTGGTATTDASGVATVGSWTLGTTAGTQVLTATAAGVSAVTFTAMASAAAAASVQKQAGDAQSATVGTAVAIAPTVAVKDAFGNAVAGVAVRWSVSSGGGVVSAAETVTDVGGVARTGWTLGPVEGTQALTAAAGALSPVVFTATGVAAPAGLNLTVAGVHVTQVVQTLGGTVPLVRGNPGLLRVFVRASETNDVAPAVRVHLFRNGTLVDTRTIAAPGRSAPTNVDESSLAGSWNLSLPASMIEPGLSVQVEVDPDKAISEANESDNVFPAGAPLSLDVRTPSTFNVRFVPVQTGDGRVGKVSGSNMDQFLTAARKLFPLNAIDADVRSVYVTSEQELQSNDGNNSWTKILSELYALRVAEASTRYYYGVVNVGYTSGIAGYGYVGAPTGIGWDYLPSGASVAAHEWGHNFGRNHAPCGNVAGADTSYPYAGGIIGAYGYDAATGALVPSSFTDLMGYCSDQWVSDYNYKAVLDFRAAEVGQGAVVSAGVVRPSLLVWGRVHAGGVELEPAFEIATRTVVPSRTGDYTVEGFDAVGRRLWSFRFDPRSVADTDSDDRHFAFAIPDDVAQPERLASIQVHGKGRSDERRLRQVAASGMPAPAARIVSRARNAGARARVEWDSNAYPMALIRDAATGEILAFARGGSAEVHPRGTAVDVILSHGVRSVLHRVEVKN